MRYSAEDIAEVCWEHNRALQAVDRDPFPDEPWLAAPRWRKKIVTDIVEGVLRGILKGPYDTQNAWCLMMETAGWKRGEKNPVRRTHPNLRPWDELEAWQRLAQQANYDTITRMGAVA